MNDTLCKFAWSGITSTIINTFRPCCRFPLDDDNQYPTTEQIINTGEVAFNNNFLIQLRKDMLNGIPRNECKKCYVEEHSNTKSMRQKANELLLAEAKDVRFEKLEFLEISLDNICNLECRMCSSRFSTKLQMRDRYLNENGITGYSPNNITHKTLDLMDSLDLSHLRMIKLLGGEPLISPNFFKFLDKIPQPQNVNLLIITNATSIPSKKTLDKLMDFKSIRFDFSIDGIYGYNDYQRVGSNFETIIANVLELSKLSSEEHSVHSVYSSLNILGLDASTKWFYNNLPFRTTIDIVKNNILSPFIAPKWYVDEILNRVSDTNPYRNFIVNMFNEYHTFDENKWNEFLKFVTLTDQMYKTDINNINPILGKVIQNI
jgi:sulfatase maturation enzyme AslB (radical SAM superfamily)